MAWDASRTIGFDIETSGEEDAYALQPWRAKDAQGWITTWAVARGDMKSRTGGHMPTPEEIRAMLQVWVDERLTVCAWNAAFEIAWLCAYGCEDLVHQVNWLDGMLLWRHLEVEPEWKVQKAKRRSFGLKAAVAEFLPEHAGYEEDVDFHDPSPEARAKLLHYNKDDADFTLQITKMLYERLAAEPRQLRPALVERASLSMVGEANYRGMVIDPLWCKALRADLKADATRLLGDLSPHGVTEKIVKSPKQLAKLLFDDWGLTPLKYSDKTDLPSTDKETLYELAAVDDRVLGVRQYREALGNVTKFAENPLVATETNNDGRAHALAQVFSTYSGRMTYASAQGTGKAKQQIGWALHQEKRDKAYRNILVAPPGYTICEFDAAGQEFRWMAVASGDMTMQALCQPGEDPHGYMASQIVSRDYRELSWGAKHGNDQDSQDRMMGKVANLSLQYRTSAKKLRSVARVQYGIPMDLSGSTKVRETYLRTYPNVPRYWDIQIDQSRRMGYVSTLGGRRVQLPKVIRRDQEWSVGSTAINYRIQGTGADQKYLAMAVLKPYMVKHGILFGFELHDGLYLYVPDEIVERTVPEVLGILNNLPYHRAWGITPPVPLPWDAKVGKSWGTLKEWNDD